LIAIKSASALECCPSAQSLVSLLDDDVESRQADCPTGARVARTETKRIREDRTAREEAIMASNG